MFELLITCILFSALLNGCMFRMQAFAFARRLYIFVEMNFQNTISVSVSAARSVADGMFAVVFQIHVSEIRKCYMYKRMQAYAGF